MKFYWLLFKIKASKETENLYLVYRRIFFGKLELVANVTVDPESSFSIDTIQPISAEESMYLTRLFKRISKLSGKTSMEVTN